MTPQIGDHFAQGADAYATPTERHLGVPARQRDDEDRAQEARFGARLIRHTAYLRRYIAAVVADTIEHA